MNYKRGFIETVGIIILGAALLVASGVAYYNTKHQKDTPFVAGSYNPTGGGTYRLQSSIGTSNTSITLTSFKEPVSNIPYTMSYLNSSIEYATIDPQTTYKEFISFSGITQNADGTATLTGVSRGLGFSYPYTASSTLSQSHSGQSILILSNPPQLTNQYAAKSNDETISGLWTFSQTPLGINPGGQPNASETVLGVSELATQLEMASSTALGGTGGAVVLQAKYATSSPSSVCGLCTPITQNNGKLHQSFLDLTQDYTWSGNHTFTGQTTIATSTTYILNVGTINATSTVRATTFVGSGSGLTGIPVPRYTYSTTTSVTVVNGYATSTNFFTIPGNVVNASSTISIKFTGTQCSNSSGGGSCRIYFRDSTGVTFAETGFGDADAGENNGGGPGNLDILFNGSIASQRSTGSYFYVNQGVASAGQINTFNSTSAINFANPVTFAVVIYAQANTTSTLGNYSIIVNP